MLYSEASLTAICFGLFNCYTFSKTNSVEALCFALGCWLTWTCQFKLFFIFLTTGTDINISFIPSVYTLGFRFFAVKHSFFFLLFTPELILSKNFSRFHILFRDDVCLDF